ncbi:MAG: CinA family protein [Alphaproteobacteria bacterium]|nr:CinA family protein [Alphaproteobacteria bacterium]
MFPLKTLKLAEMLLADCKAAGLRIATAESCTGGLVAACLCSIPGASAVFDRGFVTYSNESKRDLLGVPGDLMADVGSVSEPVSRMMAEGAVENSNAHMAVAVTGVAGPGGGTRMKPVGLVHVAAARERKSILHEQFNFGDIGREEIRMEAVYAALELLHRHVQR